MPIAATSIFNGAFTELLIDEMPMILFKQKIILYWGNKDYKLAFTTMDNTAEFTAKVALDSNTPRYLRIAGDLISPRAVKVIASQVTGQKFRLFRPGGQRLLAIIIKIARKLAPGEKELYPAWQGMQYMRDIMEGRIIFQKYDNERYSKINWTTVKEFLITEKVNNK